MSEREQLDLRKMLILCVALLFGTFGAEAYLGHTFLLPAGVWTAFIPLAMAAIGITAAAMILWRYTPTTALLFRWVMVMSLVVGLVGLIIHIRAPWATGIARVPVVAPVSFWLPAIIGLVAVRKVNLTNIGDGLDNGNLQSHGRATAGGGTKGKRAV